MEFFNTLGDRFIAAGDYNAKHTHWGSRLVTPKGKQLYNALLKPTMYARVGLNTGHTTRHMLKIATRTLTNALKQEKESSQRSYIGNSLPPALSALCGKLTET